jgi:hypothetical protein
MDSKKQTNENRSQGSNNSESSKKPICASSTRTQGDQKSKSNPVKGLTLTLYRISS